MKTSSLLEKLECYCIDRLPLQQEVARYGVVCVGGWAAREATARYKDSDISVSGLVDWPLGIGKPTVRQIEAVSACKDDVAAIEIPAPAHLLVGGSVGAIRDELLGVVIAAREVSSKVRVHVAVDFSLLMKGGIKPEAFCNAIRESGADGVVASAGEVSRIDDVVALAHCASGLRIKACATLDDEHHIHALLHAGADVVGLLPGRGLG